MGQNDLMLAKYHKIYSEKIGEDREIYVSIPEEYEKSGKKYPVIYMMDGEFNATPGLIGSIRYLEFLSQIPEFIVVGIKNTNRDKDVYPEEVTYRDGTKAGGRANQYLSFIQDELIPFIKRTYRTEDYKILFGTSNTGFTTVYAMLSGRTTFSAYIAASATLSIPSFTASRDSLVKNWKGGEKFLYLVMGEHDFPTIIRLNGALKEVIDINKPEGLTCRLSVIEGEGHVPASSMTEGLKGLFHDWKYTGDITDKEHPEVKQHYANQKRKYGFSEDFDTVSVTYVGNAGFLVTVGDKKILIDAIFKGYKGYYELPDSIQEKIRLGQPPFDGVDLLLVTHNHGDHYDAGLVRDYLTNNPKALLVSTPQVSATLKDFSDRVITFSPSKGKPDRKDLRGINIEALYLPHGATKADQTELLNYGYIVTVNGVKLFHTGDIDIQQFSFDEFRAYQLPEKKVDISFIQHFYLTTDPAESKFVREGIGSRFIIPSHYHFTTPSLDTALVLRNYPDAVLFEEELQKWIMPFTK